MSLGQTEDGIFITMIIFCNWYKSQDSDVFIKSRYNK